MNKLVSTLDRYCGALLGLACGDAVGTTVEFSSRGSFPLVTDLVGGGPFRLEAGKWTDDTSMALCLAESFLTKGAFDAKDQMARYLNWWQWGYLSSTGDCFDIGMTVRDALTKFQSSGNPYCGSSDPGTAGNGSLMRLVPVVLFSHPNLEVMYTNAANSSRTTHAANEAVESCQVFAELISRAISGIEKDALLQSLSFIPNEKKVIAIIEGDFLGKNESQIKGTGYCIDSLEAALWCFFKTDNFKDAILKATNLGDDADTTAAITGQIAGAYYGKNGIPTEWLQKLYLADKINDMATQFHSRWFSFS